MASRKAVWRGKARRRLADTPSPHEIREAFAAARLGRGGPLARLLRRFAQADLTAGFAKFGCDLEAALHFAAGRAEMRQLLRDPSWLRLAAAGRRQEEGTR